jgi:hypothetical protein
MRGGGPGMGGGMGMGGGNANDRIPVSGSYLTVEPRVKSVMDAVEFGKEPALVSMGLDKEALRGAGFFKKDSLIELLPTIDFIFLDQEGNRINLETSAIGMSIHAIRPNRLTMVFAAHIKDTEQKWSMTQQSSQSVELQIALYLKIKYNIDVDIGSQQGGAGGAGRGGMQGGGQGGMMGMVGGPGMRGGGGAQGGMMGMMGGPGMRGGGGQPGPGGRGGQQQQQEERSTVSVTQDENNIVTRIDLILTDSAYDRIRDDLRPKISVIKGEAEMIGPKPMVKLHELAKAFKELVKDRGNKFPQGAHKRTMSADRKNVPYPPDQRVSWMADLLPYLGQGEYKELYDNIDFERSWREGDNNPIVSACLVSHFLNPWSSRPAWWMRYPNVGPEVAGTHFVGIAGIGLDAAEYAQDNKAVADKIGVFHYDWQSSLEDLPKPEYTIAILQVPYSDFKMPWIAGGGSTVRGVDPDTGIEPFVCESHTYKDGSVKAGTYAIMANGDLRFIPKDIPKDVFLKMCSITQAEKIDNLDDFTLLLPPPKVEKKPELPSVPPEPKKGPPGPGKPAEAPKSGNAGGPDAKLLDALSRNCAKCHTGARAKGKNMMFNEGGTFNQNVSKDAISKALAEGKMPPKGQPPLSADDLATIQNWLKGAK